MPKTIADAVLDAALNDCKNRTTRLNVCSSQPTTYAEANATYNLAIKTVSSANLTVAAGTQRKVTMDAQTSVPITANGTAGYIAWTDSANSALVFVTTCTSQALVANGTVDVPAHKYEIASPT